MEQEPFKIRLSLKGQVPNVKSIKSAKPNHVVTIAPQMSMGELLETAHQLFGVPVGKSYEVDIYAGFPPKAIDLNDAGSKASLVSANGIRGGDAIVVRIEKITKNKKTSNGSNGQVTSSSRGNKRSLSQVSSTTTVVSSSSISSSSPLRPQRASAKAASDSFKDVIKAQDKMMKETNQKKKSSNSTKSEPTAAQIAARKKAADARVAAANSRKLAALPGGRTLIDDGPPPEVASSSPQRSRKSAKSLFSGLGSEDDISFALISSLDGGNGKVSKVLRSSMRKTVEKSYETSKAVVRNTAITSRKAEFLQSTSKTEQTMNSMGTVTVKYPKSVEGRGFYEEQVHIITPIMLKAVVKAVYDDHNEDDPEGESASGREMLKPQNMALLSPRVFWSLWYHYQDKCSNIEEALAILLPDLNWSFLHQRSRRLTEKAKENLRQEQAKTEDNKSSTHNANVGIAAIQEVERAMENMHDDIVISAREHAAQAALDRFVGGDNSVDSWELCTPSDEDIDEIKECLADSNEKFTDDDMTKVADIMIKELSIRNWRELANAKVAFVKNCLVSHNIEMSDEVLEAAISSAQLKSLDEIMLEIIDSNQDLYEVLHAMNSATPHDLSLWSDASSLIIEEAPSKLNVSESDLKKYCTRALKALKSLEWLELYKTGIV